jgi:hypothetical protein
MSGVQYGETNVFGNINEPMPYISLALNSLSYRQVLCSNSGGVPAAALNIQYTTQDVPEPAALALFGLGLASLGFARKKKNSA